MRSYLAALIVFFFCLLTTGGHLYAPDDEVQFRTAQAIALHGQLSIQPIGFASSPGRHGEYAQYGIGQALLSVPLVYLGRAITPLVGAHARDLIFSSTTSAFTHNDPSEILERFCVSFFNAFIAAILAGVFCAFAARLTGNRKMAFATALMYGLATLALAHARTYFSEPLATLCIFSSFALLYLGLRQSSARKLLAAGALAGFAVLVRVDAVVTWPALFLYLLVSLAVPEGKSLAQALPWRRIRLGLAYLIPMGLGGLIVAALNWYKFGSALSTGYGSQTEGINFGTPLLIGLQGLLFSIGRGLIYFSPPLILALWTFPALAKIERRLAWCIGLLIVTVLCFDSKWINWSGAWCWGPRHIYIVHVFLALPIAAWLAESPRNPVRRISFAVLFFIGFCVQIYGCSQDFIQFYDVMFRTAGQAPNFRALYSPAEEPWHDPYYLVMHELPNGKMEPMPLYYLGAPVNDSLYVPQNSCWIGYAAMWQDGYQDFFWLRKWKPGKL